MADFENLPERQVYEMLRTVSPSYRYWRADPPIHVDGEVIDFKDFPYIPRILDDNHPSIAIIKGAQLGLTVAAILREIARMDLFRLRGGIYLFPRDRDAVDFSKARFSRILQDNIALSGLVKDTDSAVMKRINNGYMYFRGANSVPALKSVPADDLVLDERDEMEDDMVDLAMHRLDGSKDPHLMELSTATVPDYGVDARYKESDQHVWQIKCQSCGAWTCLELAWPEAILLTKDGRYIRACRKCSKEIFPYHGEWTAQFPERTVDNKGVRGYWISQLNSARRSPEVIMEEFNRATRRGRLKEFFNSVLGMPYAEIDDALTKEILLSSCDANEVRQPSSAGPCFAGIDPGPKDFWYWIGERRSSGLLQTVNYGRCFTENDVIDILKKYNVKCAVIDEGAEVRAVRRIKERLPGVAYGLLYTQQVSETTWDERERLIRTNRTVSLDDSHRRIIDGRFRFTRADEQFHDMAIPSLTNLVRVVRTKEEEGSSKAKWIVRGVKKDHLRHALNSSVIASTRVQTVTEAKRGKQRRSFGAPDRTTFMSN